MEFGILLVVLLALILADQGAGKIKEIGILPNSEVKVSWFMDSKQGNQCVRKLVIKTDEYSNIIEYPCPNSKEPEVFNDGVIIIVDGLIYSDSDTPNRVVVLRGDKCEVKNYRKDAMVDSDMPKNDCENIKVALKERKSLKALAAMKSRREPEKESLLEWLWNLIKQFLAKHGITI